MGTIQIDEAVARAWYERIKNAVPGAHLSIVDLHNAVGKALPSRGPVVTGWYEVTYNLTNTVRALWWDGTKFLNSPQAYGAAADLSIIRSYARLDKW